MDYNHTDNKIDTSFAEGLHPQSRVWVYHSDRVFTAEETEQINQEINRFCAQWLSHNRQLKAKGRVLFQRIILLMVDESLAGASGCSIDSSVVFVKNIGTKYQANLFDRMLITYLEKGEVKTSSLHDLENVIESNSDDLFVFDNLIKTKQDLEEKGMIPMKGSWVERFI